MSEKTNFLNGKPKKKLWLNLYDCTNFSNWMNINKSEMELV
jgi:hypothetical protein